MIVGAHSIVYTPDVDLDRAFLRDVMGFKSVDAGRGWLIFALPPSEVALHPGDSRTELYLMTDDVQWEIERLRQQGVSCSPVQEERWGSLTYLTMPSGAQLGLYQPSHPTALDL